MLGYSLQCPIVPLPAPLVFHGSSTSGFQWVLWVFSPDVSIAAWYCFSFPGFLLKTDYRGPSVWPYLDLHLVFQVFHQQNQGEVSVVTKHLFYTQGPTRNKDMSECSATHTRNIVADRHTHTHQHALSTEWLIFINNTCCWTYSTAQYSSELYCIMLEHHLLLDLCSLFKLYDLFPFHQWLAHVCCTPLKDLTPVCLNMNTVLLSAAFPSLDVGWDYFCTIQVSIRVDSKERIAFFVAYDNKRSTVVTW